MKNSEIIFTTNLPHVDYYFYGFRGFPVSDRSCTEIFIISFLISSKNNI